MWLPYRKLVFYGAYLRQVQKEADRRLLAEYDLSSGQLTWKEERPADLSRRVAWALWSHLTLASRAPYSLARL